MEIANEDMLHDLLTSSDPVVSFLRHVKPKKAHPVDSDLLGLIEGALCSSSGLGFAEFHFDNFDEEIES